jgi:integrase/recombinase XerD
MLYVGLTGGLRVSELGGLRLDDVRFDGRYVDLRVRGKGRKERALLLWKEVGDALRAWLAMRGPAAVPELFLNARGRNMTRAGFAHVVRKHTATARAQCPVLREKRISPHTLRHTCALNVLQATGDIRKVSLWLGHAQQSTTEIYLHIDPTEKIAALESSVPVRLRPGRFQPADRLLASLMPSKTPSPPAPG